MRTARVRRDTRSALTRTGRGDRLGQSTGWTVFSYLIAGMARLRRHRLADRPRRARIELLFPIGMLVGLAISVGWIIYRYGRARARLGTDPKGDDR